MKKSAQVEKAQVAEFERALASLQVWWISHDPAASTLALVSVLGQTLSTAKRSGLAETMLAHTAIGLEKIVHMLRKAEKPREGWMPWSDDEIN